MSLDFKHFDYSTDLKRQRELFRLSFPEVVGSTIDSEEHYRWKFHSFPGDITSYEFAAVEDDIMAGYYAAIPYRYMVEGKVLTAGMVCDVMTHPKMRGRGVFKKVGTYSTSELQKKGVHFTTGYPIRPEVIPGHLSVGWKIAVELPVYLSPLKANAILQSKNLGFLAPVANLAMSAFHSVLNLLVSGGSKYDVEVQSFDHFDEISEDFKTFLQKWSVSQKYHLVKNEQFLKWRLGAPDEEYQIVTVRNENKIVGIAITKIADLKGIPSLAILDLMCLDGHFESLGVLFKELKRHARANGAEGIATMCSKYWALRYNFLMHGFVKTPAVFKFITKPLNLEIDEDEFMRESNWHLMWIDCDDL